MLIRLFGATTASTSHTVGPSPISGTKPRQILGILACRLGQPVAKDRLADLLWEGSPPRSYVASLESYVCILRRQLGVPPGRRAALATTSRGYLLDPTVVEVDLVEFRTRVDAAKDAAAAETVRLTTDALELVRGPLLASDAYSSWAEEERVAFRELTVAACVRAADAAESLTQPGTALWLAGRAIEADPLAERAWLTKMRALAMQGRRIEALRCYADLRRTTTEELGIEPCAEAHRLYLVLLDQGRHRSGGGAVSQRELRVLLDLLREALEAVPGVHVPPGDRVLSVLAAELVGAA